MIIVCSLKDLVNVCESVQPKYVISVIDPGYAPETPKGVKNHLKLGFDDIVKISSENKNDNVAYLQVKDISGNENEKVFIFNGWTFSSDPTIAPFDHAIYDLQLINCNNV